MGGLGALVGPFLGRRLAGGSEAGTFRAIGLALFCFPLCYVVFPFMPLLVLAGLWSAGAHLGGGARRGDLRGPEVDARRPCLADRLLDLEELLGREAPEPGDDHRGELLDASVVGLDVVVVEAPRRLDPILGGGELLLQREE